MLIGHLVVLGEAIPVKSNVPGEQIGYNKGMITVGSDVSTQNKEILIGFVQYILTEFFDGAFRQTWILNLLVTFLDNQKFTPKLYRIDDPFEFTSEKPEQEEAEEHS